MRPYLKTVLLTTLLTTIFYWVLRLITDLHQWHPHLILILPLIAFLCFLARDKFPAFALTGKRALTLEPLPDRPSLHPSLKFVSGSSLPLLQVILTWLSHLAGASVGREGVGILLGYYFANDEIEKTKDEELKRWLPYVGMATGFSALFGTPLASLFLILETRWMSKDKSLKKLSPKEMLLILGGGIFGSLVHALIFGGEYSLFKLHLPLHPEVIDYNATGTLAQFIAGTCLAGTFIYLNFTLLTWKRKSNGHLKSRFGKYLIFSLVLLVAYWLLKSIDLHGLSDAYLRMGSSNPIYQLKDFDATLWVFLQKFSFSIFSWHAGFFGGDFVTLMVLSVMLAKLFMPVMSSQMLMGCSFALLSFLYKIPLTLAILCAEKYGLYAGAIALIVNYICVGVWYGFGKMMENRVRRPV